MTDRRDAIERLLELAGPRQAPAGNHYDRARHAAHAAWLEEVRRARRQRAARMAGVSLATAALLALAAVTWRRDSAPVATPADVVVATHHGAPLRVGAALRTDARTRTALHLANGIEVRLDIDSEIAFAGASTLTLARGAVFVDTGSATGPNRSIDVRTALGTAHDVGTRFEVRLVDDVMRVRVREGVVRVTTTWSAESGERGIELVATGSGGIIRAQAPLTGEAWDWITLAGAPFDLDGKTLADFLAWVTREGGWETRFQTDALARSASTIVLSGSIDGLTPEQALRAVLATCGLTHRRTGDVVTIHAGGVS
jgi:ferric-dicitrate binding protein FerR (iron transport regulator)